VLYIKWTKNRHGLTDGALCIYAYIYAHSLA
jgi:hypothetical protein